MVVVPHELGHVAPLNSAYPNVSQPFIHTQFALVRFGFPMCFDGRQTTRVLVFGGEDDTVNSEAKALGKLKLVLRRVSQSI